MSEAKFHRPREQEYLTFGNIVGELALPNEYKPTSKCIHFTS